MPEPLDSRFKVRAEGVRKMSVFVRRSSWQERGRLRLSAGAGSFKGRGLCPACWGNSATSASRSTVLSSGSTDFASHLGAPAGRAPSPLNERMRAPLRASTVTEVADRSHVRLLGS